MTDNGEIYPETAELLAEWKAETPTKPEPEEKQKRGCEPTLSTPEILRAKQEEAAEGDKLAVPTGWWTVDTRMGKAMRPPWVAVIAARTGVGKSWAVQHLAQQAVLTDPAHRVVFITLEMAAHEMGGRIAAHALGVSPFDIERKAYAGDDLEAEVMTAQPRLANVRWRDKPVGVDDLPAVFKRATSDFDGAKPTVMVVDYAGLLTWGGRNQATQYERVSENARRLKAFAQEHGVLILEAVQLNRSGGRAGEVEPYLDSLRDSGATEEAADLVLMLWRREADEEGQPSEGAEIHVKVEKNRHGRRGKAVLIYDHAQRLIEREDVDAAY
jgi:replicative DNA helicase